MIDYYAVIVDVCRAYKYGPGEGKSISFDAMEQEFADRLQAAYPAFNREAFLKECNKLEDGDFEKNFITADGDYNSLRAMIRAWDSI